MTTMAGIIEGIQHAILTTVDDQVFKGILYSVDENTGKIGLKNVSVDNCKLSGLHYFYASNIQDLELTKERQDLKITNPANDTTNKKKKLRAPLQPKKNKEKYLGSYDSDQLVRSRCGDDSVDQGIGSSAEENENFEDYYEMDNFILFCRTCDKFRDSITYLMKQDVIAVTLFGEDISRKGVVSLIQVATEEDVIMYDILRLGLEGFVDGLQAVLESHEVVKVIHDCRMVSDALLHQYNVTLTNVFDTQVGAVFAYRLSSGGDWPRFVDSLPATLMSHLGLKNEDVYHSFVQERLKQKDEQVWLQRPLCTQLLQDSLKNIVHMLPLYHKLHASLMTEFQIGVQLYLDHVRNSPQDRIDKYMSFSHLLPFVFQDLPKLAANAVKDNPRYRKPNVSCDSKGFVQYCQAKDNSTVLTSRDRILKSKQHFTPASKCDAKNTFSNHSGTNKKQTQSKILMSETAATIPPSNSKYQDCCENPIESETNKDLEKFRICDPGGESGSVLDNMSSISEGYVSTRSAVERSAPFHFIPPSCCSSSSVCSENFSDPEIMKLGQDLSHSDEADWDADRVLELEMSQMILRQARRKHSSKSDVKKRLLPPKLKLSPKSGSGC